jgi:hypothetical protein
MGTDVKSKLTMAVNRARALGSMFPGFFSQGDTKRAAPWQDYGYPETPLFMDFYNQYKRNGIARAGVSRIVEKCWQESPWLLEQAEPHEETADERRFREFADRVDLWQKLREVDEMSRVGQYAAIILRLADDKQPNQPVEGTLAGYDAIYELIPAYEGQLTVSNWDTDVRSATYGEVLMYQFQESAVWGQQQDHKVQRSFDVHPDRVIVWSKDGKPRGESALEAGLNDLFTLQKIIGAGGEGFWKNARSAPHLQMDPQTNLSSLARSLGVPEDEIKDALGEEVEDWQKGFDNVLTTMGMEAKLLQVSLPDPEQFVQAPLQSFAASVNTPLKILVGSQTGERASTEDAKEYAQTAMSRNKGYVIPNIHRFLDRLMAFNIVPARDWVLDWVDLTESTSEQKLERAKGMSQINKDSIGTGQAGPVFTADELREVLDMEPQEGEADFADDPDADDEEDTGTPPTTNRKRGRFVVNIGRRG